MRRAILAVALLLACDPESAAPDAGPRVDAPPPTDAGPDRGAICDELGLPRRPFDASASGAAFEAVAGDFTVETLDGPWTLSEEWSGCESYVFVLHTASPYGDGLFASSPDELFTMGPRNVHWFFGAWDPDATAVRARMEELRDVVEEGLFFFGLPAEERAAWRARFHFITTPIFAAEGSVGALANGPGNLLNAFAITREQRFDPVGSLFAVGGAGFVPFLAMARFVPPYYDYLHDLDAAIEADTGATVVPLVSAVTTTRRTHDVTVTLPDAATMRGFDALEVDLAITCLAGPGDCSEWDRNAYVLACDDASCASTNELVRWITPYSRPGRSRWLMDASPLLPLLGSGGERTFRIVFGPDWEEPTEFVASVDLRLATRGAVERPIAATRAFVGGAFSAEYNDAREPFAFTPPAGTTRVELVAIVSGHGMEADNCAEWCNHVHTFSVNGGAAHVIDHEGQAGQALGCAERTGEGVPPGQWGNWAPLRAGWCPGLPVAAHRFDVTADVDLAGENALTYEGSYLGGAPRGGTIDLSVYVVSYGVP